MPKNSELEVELDEFENKDDTLEQDLLDEPAHEDVILYDEEADNDNWEENFKVAKPNLRQEMPTLISMVIIAGIIILAVGLGILLYELTPHATETTNQEKLVSHHNL